MKFNFLVIIVLLISYQSTFAQEEADSSALQISGSIDAYFRVNLNADFDQAPGTSFANLPGFSLGMANIILSKEVNGVGFVADAVFGPRGEDATFLSPFLRAGGSSNIVNQLYAYWNVSDKVTLTLGNFNTFLGYEVISPTSNFNYSTSYLFSYGPFSHTGIKADFDLGSGLTLMTGVFNPTDATEYNPTNDFVGGLQLGYAAGDFSIYANFLGDLAGEDEEGNSAFRQFDITAGYDVTNKIYLGLNTSVASDNFFGIAGYLQYQTTDDLKLGIRVESFEDQGLGLFGGTADDPQDVLNVTLSANYAVGPLTIIPEFRIDAFSTEIVASEDELTDSLSSFVLAVAYGF